MTAHLLGGGQGAEPRQITIEHRRHVAEYWLARRAQTRPSSTWPGGPRADVKVRIREGIVEGSADSHSGPHQHAEDPGLGGQDRLHPLDGRESNVVAQCDAQHFRVNAGGGDQPRIDRPDPPLVERLLKLRALRTVRVGR